MGGAPAIITLRPGVQFTAPAGASFRRLEADLGRHVDVNSTYRDWDTQMGMHLAWEAWVAGRGPKPWHSRAVHPKYSIHCQGNALDSDDWTTSGFVALAAEHGWIRTAASDPTERHHFEYQWWRDQHRNDPVPAGGSEDDMSVQDIYDARDGDGRNVLDLGRQTRADIATVSKQLSELISRIPAEVARTPVQAQDNKGMPLKTPDGKPITYALGGYLASINAQVGGTVAKVDELALAKALAPLLTANLAALSDEDVKRIAKAAADEQARRLNG